MFYLTPFSYTREPLFNPFKEMRELERSFFGSPALPSFKTDIKENETEFILEAELPGFNKEDIKAEIKDNYLTITASHSEDKEDKESSDYIRRERSYSSYVRSFDISGIKKEEISASYDNGILKLTLPKEEIKKEESVSININ